jgi:hypothetical protein
MTQIPVVGQLIVAAGRAGKPVSRGAYSGGMTNPADKITLEPRPLKVGPEWHVVATYPMGSKEHITGFRSEAEALEWMKSDRCAAWVKARGY